VIDGPARLMRRLPHTFFLSQPEFNNEAATIGKIRARSDD
jgi:hypothetical protein